VNHSLFDLGADSLHLFQIIARAARAGINITPQQILRLRTVSAIAADCDHAPVNSPETIADQITPVARDRYQLATAAPVP
jgi:hypothetical protein